MAVIVYKAIVFLVFYAAIALADERFGRDRRAPPTSVDGIEENIIYPNPGSRYSHRIPVNSSKKAECLHFGDASQFCIHRNYSLCFINGYLAYVDDTEQEGTAYDIVNDLPDNYMHLDVTDHFSPLDAFPYRFGARPYYISPKTLASYGDAVRRVAGSTAMFAVDFDFGNIYHFASTLLLAFSARLQYDLPDLDEIVAAEAPLLVDVESGKQPSEVCSDDAARKFRAILLGPENKYRDWHKNLLSIAISRCATAWTLETLNAEIQGSSSSGDGPLCFERVYIFGKSTYLLPGMRYAEAFRKRVVDLFHVTYEAKYITICLRKTSRIILNNESFVAFISSHAPTQFPVRVIDDFEDISFLGQVSITSSSAMFISLHGAALTNIIFMPRNAVVLELAPYRFNYWLYHRIARNFGLQYMRYTGSMDESVYPEPFRETIRTFLNTPVTNRMCSQRVSNCMDILRDVDFIVNISRFKPYFESALLLM